MENKNIFNKVILIVIAVGIWMIVLQNFNVFDNRQDVYVRGGYIDADVSFIDKDDIVLLHLSTGSRVNDEFTKLKCKKVILYHKLND